MGSVDNAIQGFHCIMSPSTMLYKYDKHTRDWGFVPFI